MLLSYNQVTRCHVPEVTDIHSRLHENFKTYTGYSLLRFAALCLAFEYKDKNILKKGAVEMF